MNKKQVVNRLKEFELSYKDFSDFMIGQTVSVVKGEVHYYEHDVERFISDNTIGKELGVKSDYFD